MFQNKEDFEKYVLEEIKGGGIYVFVGAGGKTSSLKAVANILRRNGAKVFLTTTTKVSCEEFQDEVKFVVSNAEDLIGVLNSESTGFLYAKELLESNKYQGLDKTVFDNLKIPLDVVILVEGDGARRKHFKIPLDHEPVLPNNISKVIILVGSLIFKEGLSEENTYNLSGIKSSKDADFTEIFLKGWQKVLKEQNTLVWVNGPRCQEGDEFLKTLFRKSRIEGASLEVREDIMYSITRDFIETIILASGQSRRMGSVKCLLKLEGESFLENLIRKYSPVSQSIIIGVGDESRKIREQVPGFGFNYFQTKNHQEGMGASLKEIISNQDQVDYLIVTPCDLPLIKKETIAFLLDCARERVDKIVVPVFQGRKGHPVVFPRKYQGLLKTLQGDAGARRLLNKENTFLVEVEDRGCVFDIDTAEEYRLVVEATNDKSIN